MRLQTIRAQMAHPSRQTLHEPPPLCA